MSKKRFDMHLGWFGEPEDDDELTFAEGAPEDVAKNKASYTGEYLKTVLR